MKASWAKDFPRLYELYRDSNQASEANYFAKFDKVLDNPNARPHYEQLEKDLEQLDRGEWNVLKQKAYRYVTVKHNRRAYEQLFNTLSEVKGYLYLKSEGYEEIHFIPEKDTWTPDLCGHSGSALILMEVKTINTSDDELDWITENSKFQKGSMQAREVQVGLPHSLKHKISDTVNTAKRQLMNYACKAVQRRIAYILIHLDIKVALGLRNSDELATYVRKQGNKQIEVIYGFRGW